MSLILDALKRADAERGRGSVPGLHSPPMPTPQGAQRAGTRKLWLMTALLVLLLLVGAAAWLYASRARAPAPAHPVVQVPVQPPGPPATVPAVPAVAQPAPPALLQVPPVQAPKIIVEAPKPTAPAAAAFAPPTRAASAAEERIPTQAELPDEVRRQLPALAISGSIYSPNPAQRLLTIGSQVYQEGDRPAPELVLERIGPKSAVFSFRGQRYSVAF